MTRIKLLIMIVFLMTIRVKGQPNCNVYKINNDENCYQACLIAIEASRSQGTRESQMLFDKSIDLCPSLDYAYFEKAVPYIKRGDLRTWKRLIDKAVELNPSLRLGYRGWCKYQFVRDYEGALKDLEMLSNISGPEIGYSQNGDYHLEIVKALCYKGLGNCERAIEIIDRQLSKEGYSPGPFDYLHLGIIYLEVGQLEESLDALKKQKEYNDYLADTYYYLGITLRKLGNRAASAESFQKARDYYSKGLYRKDPYTHPMDAISYDDIMAALEIE